MRKVIIIFFALALVSCASIEPESYKAAPSIELFDHEAAEAIELSPPLFPTQAAKRGIEGWVLFELELDEDGKPEKITVVDSYPGETFVTVSTDAIEHSTFKTVPGAIKYNYLIEFKYDD